jgi:hypothetical protein
MPLRPAVQIHQRVKTALLVAAEVGTNLAIVGQVELGQLGFKFVDRSTELGGTHRAEFGKGDSHGRLSSENGCGKRTHTAEGQKPRISSARLGFPAEFAATPVNRTPGGYSYEPIRLALYPAPRRVRFGDLLLAIERIATPSLSKGPDKRMSGQFRFAVGAED